jgi:hypothetical protein
MSDSRRGFGLEIEFIDHLRIVTINNYDSLTELHTPNITVRVTTAHIKPSVFTRRFLVTDFNTVRLCMWDCRCCCYNEYRYELLTTTKIYPPIFQSVVHLLAVA